MKLFIQLINGVPFNPNFSYTDSEILTNSPYVTASINPAPSDYNDISSIENWKELGHHVGDFLFIKDRIHELVESIGWSNLTSDEQLIGTEYKRGTHAERLARVGIVELRRLGELYDAQAIESRKIRWSKVLTKIHNDLGDIYEGPYKASEFALGTLTSVLPNGITELVQLGIGGIIDEDGIPGTLDYINATAGTPFELGGPAPGLRTMTSWIPEGYTNVSDWCDDLLTIFKVGIY